MDHFPKSWTSILPCDLRERCGILQQERLTDCGDTGQLSRFQGDCRVGWRKGTVPQGGKWWGIAAGRRDEKEKVGCVFEEGR
jgi:hypothetical protein